MIKNVYRSSCTVLFILVQFYRNLNFLYIFPKKSSNIKFHENLSSGSRVVLYGRTDMKLIAAFRNFANAPKKSIYLVKLSHVSAGRHHDRLHQQIWKDL